MTVRATILIPTHDHWATLPLAVSSALGQTVPDVEVIIIGDGATERVAAVAAGLQAGDERVRFLDLPKGPHHGEVHRGTAIQQAQGEAIFYLCDDDLLLPKHVENLLELLAGCDLVQSRNGYIDTAGELQLFPADLSDPATVDWHLKEPRRNLTSLTGTAHTRSAYLALPEGWTTTPAGEWPDHFMWKKFFRAPGFRGATHADMTALQWPTSEGRDDLGQLQRAEELAPWVARLSEPGFHEWIQAWANAAARRELARCVRESVDAIEVLAEVSAALEDTRAALGRARSDAESAGLLLEQAQARAQELGAQLDAVLASRSWRITAPLRRVTESRRDGR